jgi:hypothetical protein
MAPGVVQQYPEGRSALSGILGGFRPGLFFRPFPKYYLSSIIVFKILHDKSPLFLMNSQNQPGSENNSKYIIISIASQGGWRRPAGFVKGSQYLPGVGEAGLRYI